MKFNVFLETQTDENKHFLEILWLSWCLHQFSSLRSVVEKLLPGIGLFVSSSTASVEITSCVSAYTNWFCYGHLGSLLKMLKKIPNGLLVDEVEGDRT